MKVRNLCFDQVKGILIILVIIGHVVLGDMQKTPIRFVIYFFHMPLFLGITGYFIRSSLLDLSIKDILKKYQHRLIVPFLLAYVFYNIMAGYQKPILVTLKSMLSPYPYYHLWYVPAVLLFIFYLKFFHYLYKKQLIFIIYFLSALFLLATIYFETYLQWNLSSNAIYYWLGDKKFYYFFSYFAFGYLLVTHQHQLQKYLGYFVLSFVMGLLIFNLDGINIDYIVGFAKFLANVGLIGLVIYLCQHQKMYASPMLAKIGELSLPIYLWHILPLLLLQKLSLSTMGYYITALVVFAVFIALVIYFDDKNAIINCLFYGKVGINHAT